MLKDEFSRGDINLESTIHIQKSAIQAAKKILKAFLFHPKKGGKRS